MTAVQEEKANMKTNILSTEAGTGGKSKREEKKSSSREPTISRLQAVSARRRLGIRLQKEFRTSVALTCTWV
jgi:hypothetical protein